VTERLHEPVYEGGLRAALVAFAATMTAAAALIAPGAAGAQEPFVLSKPGGVSRWAYVERRVVARTLPATTAKRVTTLSNRTPERTANLVIVHERVELSGRLWVRVALPVLPNGTTGWIPRSALSEYTTVRTRLTVDTRRLTARLTRGGRTVFRARIGVGRDRWPTPRGEFFVRNRLTGFRDPFYGPLAFGTSARSAVLTDWPNGGFMGIHGTDAPRLLPGRVSHGCIRMRNRDVLRLGRIMPIGTPVTVR
jgi:lipoprotein-anchoring transpeptidase ErfK/SrfK